MIKSFRSGPLSGQGPDGKLLIRMREEKSGWILDQVLISVEHRPELYIDDLKSRINLVLKAAYEEINAQDHRWRRPWEDVDLLVNPAGPWHYGGSDSDDGQTGCKLVMDFYGPRLPIGGGALSGKCLGFIDRLAAYAARQAAVTAVVNGAASCQVTLVHSPWRQASLEVIYDLR